MNAITNPLISNLRNKLLIDTLRLTLLNLNYPVMLPHTLERNPRRDNLDLKMVSPFIGRLTDFLDCSPTPWHAVANVSERLERAGFVSGLHGRLKQVLLTLLCGPMGRLLHGVSLLMLWAGLFLVHIQTVQIFGFDLSQ